MPEAGYSVNADFMGSFRPANRTSERRRPPRPSGGAEGRGGRRRADPNGSAEVKHMKLHAHGAVVTKSDVRMPEDGSGDVVVNMPAK
eukprot:2605550-Pyramimonas_sp.AAC.1